MRKSGIWKKRLAVATTLCVAAGSLTGLSGCGSDGQNEKTADPADTAGDEGVVEQPEGTDRAGTDNTEENGDTKAMGRYLEEDMNLPEDCQSLGGLQALENGKLRIVYIGAEKNIILADSEDGGASWKSGESINSKMAIDIGENDMLYIMCSAISAKGDVFLSTYIQKEGDSNGATQYYCISADGEVHKLDLSALSEEPYVFNAGFTEKGTLLLQIAAKGLIEVNAEDGSKIHIYEDGNSVDYFGAAGKRLAIITNGSIHYYDTETHEPIDGGELLTEQISSNPENLMIVSTSSVPALFCAGDEEDTLFYADHKGLYRYAFGGNVVEQVIDGSLNSMGSPDTEFVSMCRDKDGVFYFTFRGGDESLSVLKYVYSKDTPSVPDTELKLYSLKENSALKQIAAIFQKKYPDIYLTIESGMSGDDAITSTDAIKTLNTEIMAGKGPDILILDGIAESTYIEKGVLTDMSGALKDADILGNIRDAYTEEDGSIYRMPVKFGIPMLQGKKENVEQVADLNSLAEVLEAHQEEYSLNKKPINFIESRNSLLGILSEVSYPAWMGENGTLEEKAVREFLEQANRIYKTGEKAMKETLEKYAEYGVTEEEMNSAYTREFAEVGYNAMAMKYGKQIFGVGILFSPSGLANMWSAERDEPSLSHGLWNGQTAGCFIPIQTVGISAKSTQKEAAEKFVQFLYSDEGQRSSFSSGLPVNTSVYEDVDYWWQDAVEGESSSSDSMTGEMMELSIRKPSEDAVREVQELGKTLTRPSAANEIILNAVTSAGSRYLKGEIGLDEACNSITQEVNLYLSE